MESTLELAWYERQLARMEKGKRTNQNLSVWTTIIYNMLYHGTALFERRRV